VLTDTAQAVIMFFKPSNSTRHRQGNIRNVDVDDDDDDDDDDDVSFHCHATVTICHCLSHCQCHIAI